MRNLLRIAFLLGMAASSFYFGRQWLILGNGGREALFSLVSVAALIGELLFNLIDHLVEDQEKPRLEMEIPGHTHGRSAQLESPKSPRDKHGNYIQRVPGGIYKYILNWSYNSIIRNHSNYHAFKPKIYLKKKYKGLTFPGLNDFKPDGLYFFKEQYVLPVENINEKEAIKVADRYILRIKYEHEYECTSEEAIRVTDDRFPDTIGDFEILMEYENGHGRKYYTLFKRNSKDKSLTNKQYLYKPLSYRFLP